MCAQPQHLRRRGCELERELEAIARLAAARDLISHIVAGDVAPQPWVDAAARLIAQAVALLEEPVAA